MSDDSLNGSHRFVQKNSLVQLLTYPLIGRRLHTTMIPEVCEKITSNATDNENKEQVAKRKVGKRERFTSLETSYNPHYG